MVNAAASRPSGGKERYSFPEAAHATACYVLAAALTAALIAVGLPSEVDASTGQPLLWWQKSSQLFVWFLPWVLVSAIVYLAPAMHVLRSKAPLPVSVILAAVLGCGPALLLLGACVAVPDMRPLLPLAFPVALSGSLVSLVGFGSHLLLRKHVSSTLTAAGVVIVLGLVASALPAAPRG